jgi:hypothetical protein
MERPVPSRTRAVRLGAELLPVLLVLASLAGTLALIMAMYRRQAPARKPPAPSVVTRPPLPPAPPPPPDVLPPLPLPAEPAEDPTPRILAELGARRAEHAAAAEQADRKAKALAEALRTPREDSARRQRRAMLVRTQLKALEERANLLETEAEVLDLERDVLGRERDAARAALAKARASTGCAILPYKGPNGTWRRPIPIECRDGMAVLEPDGPGFSLLELSATRGVRSNPLVAGILHAVTTLEGTTGPDGAPVEPYVLFVVRPDGIRPFYEARGRLEPLGIPFGYELVDQEMEIEYPALDDPSVWDSVPGTHTGAAPAPANRPGAGARPGTLPGRTPGFGSSLGPAGTSPPSGRGMPPRGSLGTAGIFPPSGSGMPPRGPRGEGEIVPRGSAGAAGPFSPADRGSPPSGRRVEIIPRDRDDLFGLEPDQDPDPHRPSWRDLVGDPAGRPSPGDTESLGSISRSPSPMNGEGRGGGPRTPSAPPTSSPQPRPSPTRGEGERSLVHASPYESAGRPGSAGRGTSTEARGTAGLLQNPGGLPDLEPIPGGGGSSGHERLPSPRVERTLELVIACGPKGVTVHPGGYRLTTAVLKAEEGRLAETLRTVVQARRVAESGVGWRPSLRFLVEPGGQGTYWTARRQMLLAGVDWPVSLRVAEADGVHTFKWERW